jgi:hypothetical protein
LESVYRATYRGFKSLILRSSNDSSYPDLPLIQGSIV